MIGFLLALYLLSNVQLSQPRSRPATSAIGSKTHETRRTDEGQIDAHSRARLEKVLEEAEEP